MSPSARSGESSPLLSGADRMSPPAAHSSDRRYVLWTMTAVACVCVLAVAAARAAVAGLSGSAMPSGLKAEIDPEEELGIGLVSTADRLGERDFIDTVVHMRYFSVLDNHRSAGLGEQEKAKLVKLPRVYGFFDWVIHTKQVWPFDKLDIRINDDAQDVLVLPNAEDLKTVRDRALLLPPLGEGGCRSLVIAGEDTRLSKLKDWVAAILATQKFSHVYFEAKDIYMENVDTVQMGFNSFYIMNNGVSNVMGAIEAARTRPKDRLIAAAWGKMWSDDLLLKQGDNERLQASAFVESQAAAGWVKREEWDASQYWDQLSHYHFMLAPAGAGIQAPKLAEAWALRVVPVTTKYAGFVDLKAQGLPMILVDRWEDLNEQMLRDYLQSPEYRNLDWQTVQGFLNPASWRQNYLCRKEGTP